MRIIVSRLKYITQTKCHGPASALRQITVLYLKITLSFGRAIRLVKIEQSRSVNQVQLLPKGGNRSRSPKKKALKANAA